ncbi:MAG: hypothetical protein JNM88_08045 [Chitinophagaceae bacterium]|nr:hypothetical protein [Chitinophagaceae bacterium]
MKQSILLLLLATGTFTLSQATPADTTIRGISIQFSYSLSVFPPSWQAAPVNAGGVQIDNNEVRRSLEITIRALNKYPQNALRYDLRTIYFLKSMKFFGVGYGGTNSTNAVYLTNNGVAMGFTELYMEQTFHHEYSSILYRNHPGWFDDKAWQANNPPGFIYNDPENGVGAIRNNASSQDLDSGFCKKGFLTEYSQSSLENDLNTFAQNLFSPSEGFWKLVDKYPLINRKVKVLVKFYNRLDPAFTEAYFRKLK